MLRFNTATHPAPTAPASRAPGAALAQDPRLALTGPMAPRPADHPADWLIPDSELVNGPSTIGFDVRGFINAYPGYLKNHVDTVEGVERDGPEIIELIARRYSVNPRLILALLEWKGGWLTKTEVPRIEQDYAFGMQVYWAKGLYKQLEWVANYLNAGYYACLERNYCGFYYHDTWKPNGPEGLNQGTRGLVYFIARMVNFGDFEGARSQDGEFMQTYRQLFGDPWRREYAPLTPKGLQPPLMKLPWAGDEHWWFTGAPHGGWGAGTPWGAIDFGPGEPGGETGKKQSGCFDASEYWARATTDGLIAIARYGEIMQDLDGDGDVRTGWVIIYNHVAAKDRIAEGVYARAGDALGHPSCEGGWSSGTHLHIARRYNGVWIGSFGPAGVPFYISGWKVNSSGTDYLGTLTRAGFPTRLAAPWRVVGQNDMESDNVVGRGP